MHRYRLLNSPIDKTDLSRENGWITQKEFSKSSLGNKLCNLLNIPLYVRYIAHDTYARKYINIEAYDHDIKKVNSMYLCFINYLIKNNFDKEYLKKKYEIYRNPKEIKNIQRIDKKIISLKLFFNIDNDMYLKCEEKFEKNYKKIQF